MINNSVTIQTIRQALTNELFVDVRVFGIEYCKHSAVITAMANRDIRSHRSIQSPKRKIETLIVLIIALNTRCTGFVTIAKGLLRFLEHLRTRSVSLTATEIADVNQCYGQFSAYVVELLVTVGDLV